MSGKKDREVDLVARLNPREKRIYEAVSAEAMLGMRNSREPGKVLARIDPTKGDFSPKKVIAALHQRGIGAAEGTREVTIKDGGKGILFSGRLYNQPSSRRSSLGDLFGSRSGDSDLGLGDLFDFLIKK